MSKLFHLARFDFVGIEVSSQLKDIQTDGRTDRRTDRSDLIRFQRIAVFGVKVRSRISGAIFNILINGNTYANRPCKVSFNCVRGYSAASPEALE